MLWTENTKVHSVDSDGFLWRTKSIAKLDEFEYEIRNIFNNFNGYYVLIFSLQLRVLFGLYDVLKNWMTAVDCLFCDWYDIVAVASGGGKNPHWFVDIK